MARCDIMNFPHNIRVEPSDDYCIEISGNAHFIIGGSVRLAFNFSEFWERLFD